MKHFHHLNWIVVSLFVVTLCLAHPRVGQMEKRVIPFPVWARDQEDEEIALSLVEIKVGGLPVVLGQPFEATEDWLKSMTLQIKNVTDKPIVAFGVGGGLLEGVSEELPPGASFKVGISWGWGKAFDPEKEKPEGPVLKPGETVELNYDQVGQFTREILARKGEGAFHKLKFLAPDVQYADGSDDPRGMRFSVPNSP